MAFLKADLQMRCFKKISAFRAKEEAEAHTPKSMPVPASQEAPLGLGGHNVQQIDETISMPENKPNSDRYVRMFA